MENKLIQFLLTAKKQTYASQGDEFSLTPLLTDTKQLEYQQGDFSYRDIYAGQLFFVGQEIVYNNNQAVWSMAYSGGILDNVTDQKNVYPIYGFLRKCLSEVDYDSPFRGPALLVDKDYTYENSVVGHFDAFHGVEKIYHSKSLVYQLNYSGGRIR